MPADEGFGLEHDFSSSMVRAKEAIQVFENIVSKDHTLLSLHVDKLIADSQPIPLIVFEPLSSKLALLSNFTETYAVT